MYNFLHFLTFCSSLRPALINDSSILTFVHPISTRSEEIILDELEGMSEPELNMRKMMYNQVRGNAKK
jgi:hypothetical protein